MYNKCQIVSALLLPKYIYSNGVGRNRSTDYNLNTVKLISLYFMISKKKYEMLLDKLYHLVIFHS